MVVKFFSVRDMLIEVADDPAIILSSQTSVLGGVCSVCQVVSPSVCLSVL